MSDDRFARAMTTDGGIRVIAARTTATARAAAQAQGLAGDAARQLGELITGAVLLREAMSPGHRLQLILRDGTGGNVVADSHPDGWNRGVVSAAADEAGENAMLTVCRTLATGALHQGIVSLEDDADISTALMRYMHSSEQIVTTIAVGATADNQVGVAGGFLIQLLPNAEAEVLRAVTEHLEALDTRAVLADDAVTPEALIASVLGEVEHAALGDGALRFGCNCSRERFIAGIDTLADDEIGEIQAAGEPLEVRCEACGQTYEIEPRELRGV